MWSNSGNRSIIAMKGHPFTRKTVIATEIAASLRCPILSLVDFLDFLSPDYFQTCPSQLLQPQDLAFRIICQIAKTHLYNQVAENIVIDSPLSSQSHLDQLIELAESLGETRLVIVECKAETDYVWQEKFEDYLKYCRPDTTKWYQPKSWEDVEKAIRDGFDERLGGYKVPKLVLDPFSDYLNYEPDSPVLIDAVRYMIKRDEDDGPDLVDYNVWRQGHYLTPCSQLGSCRSGSGHHITSYSEEGLGYEAECMACENQVMDAAYTCKHCRFALHKDCAELLDDVNKPLEGLSPEDLGHLLMVGYQFMYPPLSCRCSSCKIKDAHESDDDGASCGDCLFTTHLKSRLLPTVVRHDCHEHFLTIAFSDLNPKEKSCQCKACGSSVDNIWYSCKICGVAYDYKCLTEVAHRVEHEHGGHHHHMMLQYSSEEAEDYLCDVCFERELPERRDPRRWFYSCQDCHYVAHVRHVAKSVNED